MDESIDFSSYDEKQLNEEIEKAKDRIKMNEKSKKTMQSLFIAMKTKEKEHISSINQLKEQFEKEKLKIDENINRELFELNSMVSYYTQPYEKTLYMLNTIKKSESLLDAEWRQREEEYLMRINELKEQIIHLTAQKEMINEIHTEYDSDICPNNILCFLSETISKTFSKNEKIDIYNELMTSEYEILDKEDRVKILEDECRKLYQRRKALNQFIKNDG